MRLIGHIQGSDPAHLFGDYLYAQGVDNRLDRSGGSDLWEIWILSEDHLDPAKVFLEQYLKDPSNPRFGVEAARAKDLRVQKAMEQRAYAQKMEQGAQAMQSTLRLPMGRWTLGIMVLCGIVFLMQSLGDEVYKSLFYWLSISTMKPGGGSIGLPEVLRGEVWRLVTPIFMHGNFIHILFNLLWLKDLGSVIEYRQGPRRFMGVLLWTAVVSNLAQYWMSGPLFLGISGVVFGMLGYIWMQGRFDPRAGMRLPQGVVFMMLLWVFLGISGSIESMTGMRVANTAHVAGLVAGCIMGIAVSFLFRRHP